MYQYQPGTWATNRNVSLADMQSIAQDIQHLGGNLDGGGYGLANSAFHTIVPGVLPGMTFTVTAASWSAGVATLTIGAHSIQVNQHFVVAGITPTGYNGTDVVITTVTSTQISYAITANPGAYSSGGTVVINGTPSNGMIAIGAGGTLSLYYGGTWNALPYFPSLSLPGNVPCPFILEAPAAATALGSNQSGTIISVGASEGGVYELTFIQVVTRAASSSSTSPSTTISWTDPVAGALSNTIAGSSANTVGTQTTATVRMNVSASTNVTFSQSGFASSGGTSMQFYMIWRLKYEG